MGGGFIIKGWGIFSPNDDWKIRNFWTDGSRIFTILILLTRKLVLLQRIDIIIGMKSSLQKGERIIIVGRKKWEMRCCKFGCSTGEGGQQINFDRPLFLLHPPSALERDESSNKWSLGACYREERIYRRKIQVKGPLRRNRTLSN